MVNPALLSVEISEDLALPNLQISQDLLEVRAICVEALCIYTGSAASQDLSGPGTEP